MATPGNNANHHASKLPRAKLSNDPQVTCSADTPTLKNDKNDSVSIADAGNVWDLSKSESRPGGAFQVSNLLNSVAVGAGIGLRLDITFFVFRLDVAFPLRDPRYPLAKPQNFSPKPVLSVGYPF